MLQLPSATPFGPSWTSVTKQPPPAPSETLTWPDGQTVPLAGVTVTWTLSVVPVKVAVCVVPAIAVVVPVVVAANAVPGVSRTPPARPPSSTAPAATPAVRRQARLKSLYIREPFRPLTQNPNLIQTINVYRPY